MWLQPGFAWEGQGDRPMLLAYGEEGEEGMRESCSPPMPGPVPRLPCGLPAAELFSLCSAPCRALLPGLPGSIHAAPGTDEPWLRLPPAAGTSSSGRVIRHRVALIQTGTRPPPPGHEIGNCPQTEVVISGLGWGSLGSCRRRGRRGPCQRTSRIAVREWHTVEADTRAKRWWSRKTARPFVSVAELSPGLSCCEGCGGANGHHAADDGDLWCAQDCGVLAGGMVSCGSHGAAGTWRSGQAAGGFGAALLGLSLHEWPWDPRSGHAVPMGMSWDGSGGRAVGGGTVQPQLDRALQPLRFSPPSLASGGHETRRRLGLAVALLAQA